MSFDIGRLALVAIAVALWVAVFRGFNAFYPVRARPADGVLKRRPRPA